MKRLDVIDRCIGGKVLTMVMSLDVKQVKCHYWKREEGEMTGFQGRKMYREHIL